MRASIVALFVVIILLLAPSSCPAGWFGPSAHQVLTTSRKYFNKDEASLADFLAIDLAAIESAVDAKVLYKTLARLLNKERAFLDAKLVALEASGHKVHRYFGILYRKEARDALFHQTRSAKQSAYRKALFDYNRLLDACRKQTVIVRKGETVYGVLKRVARCYSSTR